MAELTVERLREVLNYDPDTGVWTWRVNIGSRAVAGRQTGTIDVDGYHVIRIDKRLYRAGRLAHLYMTGRWPHPEIDHKNRKPADDRWDNLREATSRLNNLNRGLNCNNRSGFKGVCWDKSRRKWVAQTKVNYRVVHLGRFDTKEEAHCAYLNYHKTI